MHDDKPELNIECSYFHTSTYPLISPNLFVLLDYHFFSFYLFYKSYWWHIIWIIIGCEHNQTSTWILKVLCNYCSISCKGMTNMKWYSLLYFHLWKYIEVHFSTWMFRVFVTKKWEIIGICKRRNEQLHSLYSSPHNISIIMIKWRLR
jgi:hypothetical protein